MTSCSCLSREVGSLGLLAILGANALLVALCRQARFACNFRLFSLPITALMAVHGCQWLWTYAMCLDYHGLLKPASIFLGT